MPFYFFTFSIMAWNSLLVRDESYNVAEVSFYTSKKTNVEMMWLQYLSYGKVMGYAVPVSKLFADP